MSEEDDMIFCYSCESCWTAAVSLVAYGHFCFTHDLPNKSLCKIDHHEYFQLQVDEILNFALLTGKTQIYPLHVYLVSDSDTVVNAVEHAACHSKETDVLKVCFIIRLTIL